MSTKKDDHCIKKAFDDEMLFVLMARDASSPLVVLEWIKLNLYQQPNEKLLEAFQCALKLKEQHPNIRNRADDDKHKNDHLEND